MELVLREDVDGLHILSGQRRLEAALSLADEVIVDAPGIGKVLIMKTPSKHLAAVRDEQTVALFGL